MKLKIYKMKNKHGIKLKKIILINKLQNYHSYHLLKLLLKQKLKNLLLIIIDIQN